jgi:uncharacterized lipoprotein YehR (DUF1307 family)
MSNSIKAVVALGLFFVVSACGQQEETVFVNDDVMVEQPTTKY